MKEERGFHEPLPGFVAIVQVGESQTDQRLAGRTIGNNPSVERLLGHIAWTNFRIVERDGLRALSEEPLIVWETNCRLAIHQH